METSTDASVEAIQTQLARILASPGFVHSDRMARFLRFAVEQTIQGHADSLKESVLGMEVFDRTSSFDPRTDTIVRVEARRLRSKLKEYYETHGQHDAVLIEFPKGSYVPTFQKCNGLSDGALVTQSEAGLHNEAKPWPQSRSTKPRPLPILRIALGLVALLGAGGATLWWFLRPAPAPVEWKLRPLTADSGLTTTPALSADGKLVAYASDRTSNGTNLDLWVQPLARGSEPLQLTKNPADDMSPTFSPDGGQIAFFSRREGGGIYLISTLGGPERLLVRGGHDPRFSSDGRWIAYSSGAKGWRAESKVFIVPAEGGTPKQIAADIPWASGPIWSPDGRRLLVLGALTAYNTDLLDFWLVSPEGGASAKTGLVPLLRSQDVSLLEEERPPHVFLDWVGNSLVFGSGPSIWTIEFKNGSLKPGELRKIASGTTTMVDVRGSASKLVFESHAEACHLWSLPLDLNTGTFLGSIQPLPHAGGSQIMPASSSDGSKLVYLQSGPDSQELRLRDMTLGTEKVLRLGGARPKMSPDGAKVAYVPLGWGPLFIMDSSGGESTKLVDRAGGVMIFGWSTDGKRIVFYDGVPPRFSAFDPETHQISELISHPDYTIHGAEISPDGNWVAFHLPRPGSEHLKIAALRKGTAAPEGDWITVTTAAGSNRRPWWSPDGNLLYFLSMRDTYQCIWAQPLDPLTKRPRGEPTDVYHFHETKHSLNARSGADFGPAVGGGRIVFGLSERSGNIWMAERVR